MRKLTIILLILISFLSTSHIYSQWYEQATPITTAMRGMVFFDANTGIISYQNGQVIRTSDGGANWTIVLNANVLTLKKVDDSAAFGLGAGVLIYKTTDRGISWNSAGAGGGSVKDCYFVNRDTGWFSVFGGPSGIYKTTDGGQSMFLLSSGASFGVINFLNKKYNGEYFGWHENDLGLRLTTNSGVNWYKPSTDLDSINFGCVTFLNRDTGWASGSTNFSFGRIYYTSNGGLNWIKQFDQHYDAAADLNFTDYKHGWGGTEEAKVFGTSNGGGTWGFQNIPIFRIRSVFMIDSLTGWCGDSKLIHTTNGGGNIVKIMTQENYSPSSYILKQNYPNPFNPTSIIEFTIKDDSKVSLIIYDLMGREIMKLFENKNLQSGTYQSIADFSNSNLSSGTYFYKLIIQGKEDIVLIKKMTFVK